MKKLLEFFEESNGTLSNTRLTTTATIGTALWLVVYSTMHGSVVDLGLLTVLFGYSGVTKVASKMAEEKTPTMP